MIKRVITGLLLLGIGIFVVIQGGVWLFLWTLGVGILCLYELVHMIRPTLSKPWLAFILAIFSTWLLTLLHPNALNFWSSVSTRLMVFCVLLLALFELLFRRLFFQWRPRVAVTRGLIFLMITIPFIFLVREMPDGLFWMFAAMILVSVSDSSAYFGGRSMGRTPLSVLSPRKTIEGSVVAVVATVIVSWLFAWVWGAPVLSLSVFAVIVSILSQVGDLHESLTKRFYNIKDSSQLLPGHGGFYDRADGYLFVMPFVFYWGQLLYL